MRPVFFLLLGGASSPAFAHSGHIADLAGHSHWAGLAALAGAAAVIAALKLKERKEKAAAAPKEEKAAKA